MAGSLRWRPASFWVLACALLFCGFLLTAAQRSFANELKDSVESLRFRLENINVLVRKLEDELLTWKSLSQESMRRVEGLQAELATLREELQNLQTSYGDSESQVAGLKESLRISEQKLAELSKTWTESQKAWKIAIDAQAARVRRARLRTVLVGMAAFLAGAAAGWVIGQ